MSEMDMNEIRQFIGLDPIPKKENSSEKPWISEEDKAELLKILEEGRMEIYCQSSKAARTDPMSVFYNRLLVFLGVILVLAILHEFGP